jgi:chloramphenicol 3-O phosphotransferase
MFADKGINLIVDHVIHDPFTRMDFAQSLSGYPVLRVCVHCPVEELERRERERGNREIGQALKQLEFVHKDEVYDVEVNTYADSVEYCAEIIVQQAMKQAGPIS